MALSTAWQCQEVEMTKVAGDESAVFLSLTVCKVFIPCIFLCLCKYRFFTCC